MLPFGEAVSTRDLFTLAENCTAHTHTHTDTPRNTALFDNIMCSVVKGRYRGAVQGRAHDFVSLFYVCDGILEK